MNAKQALTQARARWGKKAMVEDRPTSAVSPEQRAAAKIELARLKALPKEQQDSKLIKQTAALTWRYRYQVGQFENMLGLGAFFIRGQGDSWEEAFADADKSYPRKAA